MYVRRPLTLSYVIVVLLYLWIVTHMYQENAQKVYRITFMKYYRKILHLTGEFHVKFHLKNRYRTNREAMSAISVFQVKFNVEFTSQVDNFL